MKLVKKLFVNDTPVGLVREHVFLDISTPGRADFTVRGTAPLSGIVHFEIGDAGKGSTVDFFTGYIDRSNTVDGAQQRIFCRELSAVLWSIIPVSLRNVSLNDVLNVYSRETGLTFVKGTKPYATTPQPVFQTVASGVHGLDTLGNIYKIPDFIWQQQGDGDIFVGDWQDSRWSGKPFEIDESFFQDVQLDGTKTLQAIPGLRPGVMLNGQYITSLQLKEHFMVVKCEQQLNA
jgi:hypothetical protein